MQVHTQRHNYMRAHDCDMCTQRIHMRAHTSARAEAGCRLLLLLVENIMVCVCVCVGGLDRCRW